MGEMTLEEFLASGSSGGRSKYLTKWRKNSPPVVDVWLHTKAKFVSFFHHAVPKFQERTDRETREATVEIWSDQFPCYEHESVCAKQYFRDPDGNRQYPARICPVCLLLEDVRAHVLSGDVDLTAELFKFEGTDPQKGRVIHAGGVYGGFGKDLSDSDKVALKKARIYLTDAWQESWTAGERNIFLVVDNAAPEEGVQIAMEGKLLGDLIRETIRSAITSVEEEGNPFLHPYALRWIYKPAEKSFTKKYAVIRMERLALTSEIEHLIRDGELPDISRIIAKRDPNPLMEMLKDGWQGAYDIDWEPIFEPILKWWEKSANTDFDPEELEKPKSAPKSVPKSAPKSEEVAPKAAPKPLPKAAPKPLPKAAPKPSPKVAPKAAPKELVSCEICGAKIDSALSTCPDCGEEVVRRLIGKVASNVVPLKAVPASDPDENLPDDDLPY